MTSFPVSLIKLLRLHQWLKNLILFFPPFLGGILFDPGMPLKGFLPFVAFCLASSSTYIFNDIVDARKDARHPRKRTRPIAAGDISPRIGGLLASVFGVGALLLALQVSGAFLWVLGGYVALSSAYTLRFKDIVIVDLFCISVFFLLRLEAGGLAFGVEISDWLFLSVFLLALFLSTGKRLCERGNLGSTAGEHRQSLNDYPDGLLDGIMYMTGGAVLVTYTLHVISRHGIVYTVPLCCFGLMRYMLRVKAGRGGDPTWALLKDPVLFLVGLVWVLVTGWMTYAT